MNNNEKQFENFVREIKFDDTPDPSHRDKLEQDLLCALAKRIPRQIKIWRTIMKTKIAKLAVAAAVILIGIFSITLLDRSTTPAWAIEETVEALDRINAVYFSGTIAKLVLTEGSEVILWEDKKIPLELWAQANKERTQSGNIRVKLDNGKFIGVIYDMTTYSYDANKNTVLIETGQKLTIDPWFNSELARQSQEPEDLQVLYGKDAATGRDQAFATFVNSTQSRSWWFEFDVETKLPVRAKGWPNTRHEGVPAIDCQRFVYFEEQLPDEFFKFEIPEGATVIDKRQD